MSENEESLWRVCPNCGLLSPAGNEECQCGYRFQTKYLKAAVQKAAPREPAYYVEAMNGMTVRVPVKDFDKWSEAQKRAVDPLTPAERKLADRMELLYGKEPVCQQTHTVEKKKSSGVFGGIMLLVSLVAVVTVFSLAIASSMDLDTPVPASTPRIVSTPRPVTTPRPTLAPRPVSIYNGKILRSPIYEGQCPLTIQTPSGSGGYYIYLRYDKASSRSLESRVSKGDGPSLSLGSWGSDLAFYVAAGKTFNIDVPVGIYVFSYCHGTTWYGEKLYFGDDTLYYKSDEDLEFYTDRYYSNGHTISLIKQTNGNFDTNPTTKDQFPA